MKFSIPYPVNPYKLNQAWGVFNEDPQNPGHSIYEPLGFKLHNGVDLNLINGQSITCPFPCQVLRVGSVENGMWQPKGGGIFVGLLSTNTYQFDDGKNTQVLLDFLHCKEILVSEGQILGVGDIVAYGDNTGFSTGPHTHVQARRVSWIAQKTLPVPGYRFQNGMVLVDVDTNDANNSFDLVPYFNGQYADSPVVPVPTPVITPVSPAVPATPIEQQVVQKQLALIDLLKQFIAYLTDKLRGQNK